jgi:murein DD-endopeptidase MepM/ murein hydrolase activator NlpD
MATFAAPGRQSRLLLLALGALALTACAAVKPANGPPAPGSFTTPVFPGDTLTSVAERHQVSVNDLVVLNTVKNPNRRLARGWVRIPAAGQMRAQPVARAPQPAATLAQPAATSQRAAPAAPLPQAAPAAAIHPRPPSVDTRALEPLPAAPSRTPRMPASSRIVPAAVVAAVVESQQPPAPSDAAAEPMWYDWMVTPAQPAEPAVEPDRRFVWPVVGRVISAFGDRPDGGRNDGINISTERGAPVHAAESGEVTYVGNELKGYGNLILIRHDNGFTTAYAHADGVLVKRGQRVARGEVIASAGATGDVSQPQLHFELRRGTRPVDPTLFLTPQVNSSELLAESTR